MLADINLKMIAIW